MAGKLRFNEEIWRPWTPLEASVKARHWRRRRRWRGGRVESVRWSSSKVLDDNDSLQGERGGVGEVIHQRLRHEEERRSWWKMGGRENYTCIRGGNGCDRDWMKGRESVSGCYHTPRKLSCGTETKSSSHRNHCLEPHQQQNDQRWANPCSGANNDVQPK